jgi:NTP pyrophosphatase (non-canonical NTP hydrolase)
MGRYDFGGPREPFTLRRLQEENREWCDHNFPNRQPYQPLLGALEELGELAHAHLKGEQGIRTNQDHNAAKVDAVADVIIFLADYCNQNGIDMQDAVESTWAAVKQRDWRKDPVNAGVVEST